MATSRLNLTRDQLATFLKDHEQIKQFERLFATVDAIAPDFVNEVAISAGTAQATANDALALIEALENSLTADGAVTDAKATLALQELQALKSELQLKTLEPVEQYNNAIITDYLTINEYGRGENAVGRIIWDDGEGTIDVGLKGGNIVCKIGIQEYVRAYNETLLTMTKGQIVYISGAQGNRVAVKLAQADGDANSAHTIGIVAETITAGGEGFIQISGPIYKLDTLGTIAGDTVYLSPTIAGDWTTTKPVAPDHLVIIGFIERVHASVGSIFIKIDNGYELDELHNVKITSVQPDDLLQYDSGGPYWKNVAPSTVSIGTATNLAGGAAGSVPYQTGAGATTFLPIGSATQVLKVNSGATAPEWVSGTALTKVDDTNVTLTLGGTPASALLAATSLTLGWTGTLSVARGGTGQSSYAVGDLLYASTTSTLANLADVATGNALISGGVGVAPSYGKIGLTTHVSGTLPVANGGTGTSTAFTTGSVVFAGASGVYSQNNTKLFWDNTNSRLGIGTTTPSSPLTVYSANNTATIKVTNGLTANNCGITLETLGGNVVLNNNNGTCQIIVDGTITAVATAAGEFGINTAAPGATLDVGGSIRSETAGYPNYLYNTANRIAFGESFVPPNEAGSVVQFGSGANTRDMVFAFSKTGVNTSFLGNDGTQMMLGSESTAPITFRTGLNYNAVNIIASGAERMRIDSAGNVGIGSASPNVKLDVTGAAAFSTSATTPIVYGGTGTTSTLSLRATSGVGTTNSDIIFGVGNNGAVEAMRLYSTGQASIANSNMSGAALSSANPAKLHLPPITYTDTATPASTTEAIAPVVAIRSSTIAATNTAVTYNDAASLYLSGAPIAGTNVTLGNSYALYINTGQFRFPGDARKSIVTTYTDSIGDVYGMEQVSPAQSGTNAALRLFCSSQASSVIAFGKYTSATAFTEFGRFSNTGNLGIGTASPGSPLTVYAANNQATIKVTNGPSANNVGITLESLGGNVVLNNGNGPFQLSVGGSLRAVVTTAGNVGIGTSTNLSTLTVNGSFASKSPSTVNAATYTVAATDGSLRFTTTNCTVTLPTASSFPGRILYLNTITANSVTSASSNVIPLGSNTAGTAILAATAGKFAMIQSNGTSWITMMAN